MKKITLSLFAIAASCASVFSQVVLQEDFNEPFNPTAAGWIVQNNSVPAGAVSWTQGNQTGGNNGLTAYNGFTDDFYMADFLAVNNVGGISAWLITPAVTIYNGGVLQFAVSTLSFAAQANVYPDRLQVRMSPQAAVAIPAGTTAVGTFTDVLLDINPNLTTNYATAVSNGTINGFPGTWTVYQLPITGVTGTVTGRFAFRYFVNNGGASGANSRLVGVDAVRFTLPCGPTVQSYTTCPGANTTLDAIGGLPATTYSWSNGSTNSSIIVNPNSTTVYTLFPSANGVPCGNQITATVTTASNLGISISPSSPTICSGQAVTLSASSPATTYSWNTGATSSAITVTPNTTTTYSVGGLNGICVGGNTVQVTVLASPNISVSLSPACLGGSFTINASGAATYTYLSSSANPQTIATPTAAGGYNFLLLGSASNGCISGGFVTFTVNPSPTVTAVSSKSIACVNTTITMTGNGATSYTWTYNTNQTSTVSPLTYSTGGTVGVKSFTLVGVDGNGCSAKVVKTVTVAACTGVEDINGNLVETSVFPNPFTNELRVSGLTGKVEIFNALGQLVISTRVTETETINTSDLAKGAYLLKAYSQEGQEVKTIKLLKN